MGFKHEGDDHIRGDHPGALVSLAFEDELRAGPHSRDHGDLKLASLRLPLSRAVDTYQPDGRVYMLYLCMCGYMMITTVASSWRVALSAFSGAIQVDEK